MMLITFKKNIYSISITTCLVEGREGKFEPYDKDPADFYKKYLKKNKDYFKIYTFTDF